MSLTSICPIIRAVCESGSHPDLSSEENALLRRVLDGINAAAESRDIVWLATASGGDASAKKRSNAALGIEFELKFPPFARFREREAQCWTGCVMTDPAAKDGNEANAGGDSQLGWRRPTPPGDFLRDFVIKKNQFTHEMLAERIRVSRRTISQLVNGQRSITPNVALRLGKLTNTSPEFWMNLQSRLDLWDARQKESRVLSEIMPLMSESGRR
jgi:antitoxin HigA-1